MSLSQIPQHAPVHGADGVPIGAVGRIEGRRLKITQKGRPERSITSTPA